MRTMLAHAGPHGLADWNGLFAAAGAFGAVVVALALAGRTRWRPSLRALTLRISEGLERVSTIPGWAAAMVGTASFGLLVAGMGFYNDVAWHVGLGRDEQLFTAPHTAIVIGLFTILASAGIGVWFATATEADVGFRVRELRVPWSGVAMALLGASAVSGFPLDELWHRRYGIDVTMWSPTHLFMIVGASLSPLVSWLALGEAGVTAERGKRATGVHVAVGSIALLGLSSAQGEFAFGVPQFQQVYHPVLAALAAGFALTAMGVVVRRWWAPLVVGAVSLWIGAGDSDAAHTEPRSASLYLTAAIGVALVAKLVGTERRGRFAIGAGLAVGTVGLAGEWLWSQGGYQPWGRALLPEAPILAGGVAIAAAALGAAFGAAVRREPLRMPAPALTAAALVVLIGLTLPLPRRGSDAEARIRLEPAGRGVVVQAELEPADAAEDARWFQVIAWQGGGYIRADMLPMNRPGMFRSERAVPVTGKWKTILRLHRGAAMVAIPIRLPADAEIAAPEIPATDKEAPFVSEQRYLLREQHPGPGWFAAAVYTFLAAVVCAWIAALMLVPRRFTSGRITAASTIVRV